MFALIINDGFVAQIETEQFPVAEPFFWVECPSGTSVGDTYRGGKFSSPEPVPPFSQVPQSVTRAQGKAALIQAGLWDDVLTFVAEISDDTERALAEVALHDTQDWRRSSPFMNAAASALGLSEAGLDSLFIQAQHIEL